MAFVAGGKAKKEEPEKRALVLAAHRRGKKAYDIAREMGLPSGTVYTWIKRGAPGRTGRVGSPKRMAPVWEDCSVADFTACRALWVQGEGVMTISKRTGVDLAVVHRWAERKDWKDARRELEMKVTRSLSKAVEKRAVSLAERSASVRSKLAALVERSADKLCEAKLPTVKATLKLHKDARPLVENASRIFDWHESAVVNVNTLINFDPAVDLPAAVPAASVEAVVKAKEAAA